MNIIPRDREKKLIIYCDNDDEYVFLKQRLLGGDYAL